MGRTGRTDPSSLSCPSRPLPSDLSNEVVRIEAERRRGDSSLPYPQKVAEAHAPASMRRLGDAERAHVEVAFVRALAHEIHLVPLVSGAIDAFDGEMKIGERDEPALREERVVVA